MITAQQTVVNDWEFRDVFRGQTVSQAMCSMQPGGLRVGGCLVCQLPWKTLAALAA